MLKALKQHLAAIHRDDRGAMSVEKILILAVIALPILIVLYLFKAKIVGWFNNQASALDQSQNGGAGGAGATGGTGVGG